MRSSRLVLECINGPLDGQSLFVDRDAEWRRTGEGPLCFPWDAELGDPQARLFVQDGEWWIAGYLAPHGTYRVSDRAEKIVKPVQVVIGDLLKASRTWLLITHSGT